MLASARATPRQRAGFSRHCRITGVMSRMSVPTIIGLDTTASATRPHSEILMTCTREAYPKECSDPQDMGGGGSVCDRSAEEQEQQQEQGGSSSRGSREQQQLQQLQQ